MDDIIDAIVQLEWKFFDKVQNEGGRADCQDDWQTFSVMRRSQYQAWTGPMLESWLSDLLRAYDEGRNPLTEKYGYMMFISDPQGGAEVASRLPQVTDEKKQLAAAIVKRLLPLNEAYRQKYPHVAGRGRPLRTSEEAAVGWTSIETYETGELWTYSQETLKLFDEHLAELEKSGQSYPEMVVENGLKQRGFESIQQAEEYLAKKAKG